MNPLCSRLIKDDRIEDFLLWIISRTFARVRLTEISDGREEEIVGNDSG